MKTYIGTKIIRAMPMTRAEYNAVRGWEVPADENGADEGYLVEYTDGGKPNHPDYAGYVSWSPKAQFDAAYKEVPTVTRSYVCGVTCQKAGPTCNGYCANASIPSPGSYTIPLFDFGRALHMLKEGKKVARIGWNGKSMWLGLHKEGGTFIREECGTEIAYADYIVMKTADNKLVPWLASQTDMLAEDWSIV